MLCGALNNSRVVLLAEEKIEKLPRLAGATLLTEYPPGNLSVTTGNTTSTLTTGGGYWFAMPSMSADGRLVAAARTVTPVPSLPRGPQPSLVRTYSTMDKEWTETKLEVMFHSVALSPDGLKLACVSRGTRESPSRLQFMDLRDGTVKSGPEVRIEVGMIYLSWSANGRRIAFNQSGSDPFLNDVHLLDVEVGTSSKLAKGLSPAWSPSGDWIAFFDYEPGRDDVKHGWYAANANRISMIRPDGTDYRTLVTLGKDESLVMAPVWSPDSKTLLINRFRYRLIAHDNVNIDILDLATGKLRKKFRNIPPVFAWIKAN